MPVIALRPVEDADLDALFDQMRDPEAVRMAAFTTENPDDRRAFDAHMARVRSSPDITMRAITCDGQLAGSIASFVSGDQTEVTYWIDRPAWGRGIATQALELLLNLVPTRPLHARAASDNIASLKVLQKAASTSSEPRTPMPPRESATSRKPSSGWSKTAAAHPHHSATCPPGARPGPSRSKWSQATGQTG